MGMEVNEYDWLTPAAVQEKIQIPAGEALLFSMPVYGSFIPHICAERVSTLEGNHTPAVIAAVYGNRHYDDALVQMRDLLEKQGFIVIAAGAFLAEHSIFTTVAAGRPDEDDRAAMKEFAGRCRDLLAQRELWEDKKIQVPGKTAYDPSAFKGVPFHPDGDEKCVGCGKCVQVCPQGAISRRIPVRPTGRFAFPAEPALRSVLRRQEITMERLTSRPARDLRKSARSTENRKCIILLNGNEIQRKSDN